MTVLLTILFLAFVSYLWATFGMMFLLAYDYDTLDKLRQLNIDLLQTQRYLEAALPEGIAQRQFRLQLDAQQKDHWDQLKKVMPYLGPVFWIVAVFIRTLTYK